MRSEGGLEALIFFLLLTGFVLALYTYIYRLLIEANTQRDTEKVDEALSLIKYERETWVMLMEKAGVGESTNSGAA